MEHRYAPNRSTFLDALRPSGQDGTLPIYYNRQQYQPVAYDNAKKLRRGYPWVAARMWLRNNWGPPLFIGAGLVFLAVVFIFVGLIPSRKNAKPMVVYNGNEPDYVPRDKLAAVPKDEEEKHAPPARHGEDYVPPQAHRQPDHRKVAAKKPGHLERAGRVVPHKRPGDHKPPAEPPAEGTPKTDEEVKVMDAPAAHQEENGQKVVAAEEPDMMTRLWQERANGVREAFLHSWDGYRKYAWGYDHLLPLSKRGEDWFGLGLTITDSLSTMWIMNLTEEFNTGRDWIASELKFTHDGDSNVFEITIRAFAGMLSAYHFSKDPIFLSKAKELGDILMPAFNTASKLPLASINFARREAVAASFNGGASSTAEVATLQLEFKYLSVLTNDPKYWKAVEQVMLVLESLPKVDGLVPIFINPISGKFEGAEIRMGSRGDSYYEYLLKQYIQTNRTETAYRRAWDESMNGVKRRLISHSKPHNLTFVGELPQGANSHTIYPKMDHLVCFLGGALALGASPDGRLITDRTKLTSLQQADLQLGEELTHTCYMTYKVQATGLAPEIVYFNTEPDKDKDIEVRPLDAHNLLRPETVESLFVLWRITGDVKYREWGWEIFQNFVKYCRVGTGGYTSLNDVTTVPPPTRDKQESFWLAETLKYLYLLFSPVDLIPLSDYVFNTEAHPLPIFSISDELKHKLSQ